MVVVRTFGGRIAREENTLEHEHRHHAYNGKYDNQRIGLPLHCRKGRQNHRV